MFFVDLETRSSCDIKNGVTRYTKEPDFTILMGAFLKDSDETLIMFVNDEDITFAEKLNLSDITNQDYPVKVSKWLFKKEDLLSFLEKEKGSTFVAHNAPFEMGCFHQFLPRWDQADFICTQAMCSFLKNRFSLAKAVDFFCPGQSKLESGGSLINRYCIPNEAGDFEPFSLDDIVELIRYNIQDVVVDRALFHSLPRALDDPYYLKMTVDMNRKGIPIDASLCQKVTDTLSSSVEQVKDRHPGINLKSHDQVIDFSKSFNVFLPDARIGTLDKVLKGDIPQNIRDVLEARKLVNQSSTAKYSALLNKAHNNRVHDCFIYCGAHTGRDSGVDVQPQNFPRGNVNACALLPYIDQPDMLAFAGQTVFKVAKEGLRGTIRLPKDSLGFICSDFSNIETRVLLFIAGEHEALKRLHCGVDPYKELAADIYGVHYDSVTDDQRQMGKQAILGLGFGMGSGLDFDGKPKKGADGSFSGFKKYLIEKDIDAPDDLVQRAVDTYRSKFSKIPEFWQRVQKASRYVVERACLEGVPDKASVDGFIFECTKIKDNWFFLIQLLSGRKLVYLAPYLTENGIGYLTIDGLVKVHERKHRCVKINNLVLTKKPLWGGSITQNITQSTARDVFFNAHKQLSLAGYHVVARIHDEFLCEKTRPEQSLEDFNRIIQAPLYAHLPIASSGWEGHFYRK